MAIFNEQQQQVLDAIKCPITRQIMANLMMRAKDAPKTGGGTVRPISRAQSARKRERP